MIEKLEKAICLLIKHSPFYGIFATHLIIEESKRVPTCGVLVKNKKPYLLYNREFIESLNIYETAFVMQHEIEHLVRMHLMQTKQKDHNLLNIAQDMAIHGHRTNCKIGLVVNNKKHIPMADELCWVPKDWNPNLTAEEYYRKLEQNATKIDLPAGPMDDHGLWDTEDTQIIKDVIGSIVNNIASTSAGTIPGHLEDYIEALNQPTIYWPNLFRQYIGSALGRYRYTYSRRSKRIQKLGYKGRTQRGACTINVIVDTSGSITKDVLQQFFSEIEAMASHANIYLCQWDTELNDYSKYRKGDWKSISIKGRGGTSMDLAVYWLEKQRLIADVQIMLTDGYTPWPRERAFPMIFAITTDVEGPNWGHVLRIK